MKFTSIGSGILGVLLFPFALLFMLFRYLGVRLGLIKNYTGRLQVGAPDPKTGEFRTIGYTPYFELRETHADEGYRLKLVITMGSERLPEGVMPSPDRDLTDRVTEVYLLNDREQAVDFAPVSLSLGGSDILFISTETRSVEPRTAVACPPAHDLDINMSAEEDVVFTYRLDGEERVMQGVAQRLSDEDLRRLYSAPT